MHERNSLSAAGRDSGQDLYEHLRTLDDGLVPLDMTNLMNLPCWQY